MSLVTRGERSRCGSASSERGPRRSTPGRTASATLHWYVPGLRRHRWLPPAAPVSPAAAVAAESAGPELPATGGVIEAGMVRLSMFVALAFVAAGAMLASVGGYLVWQRKET